MTGILDGVMERLGPDGVARVARSLGTDERTATAAIEAALPAIVGGMANNTRDARGATALDSALGDHDGQVFNQLDTLLGSDGGDGAKILGHVLGRRQPYVEQKVSQSAGIDLGLIMKLLPILAPLVMGYLSGQKQDRGLDAGGLGEVLGAERQEAERRQPGLGGLGALLDADGDGSALDDILGRLLKG